MSTYGLTLSTLTVSILLATSATAAEHKTPDETMVVTASGFEQSEITAPASISVLTRDELENKYYRDVTDALKTVPGVTITGGGDTKDISIRGMGAAYSLILVDGKRISTRQTRPNSDGAGIEAAWLPPIEAIERIEVIRGPMSTLYGSDAIGGVVNIITRKDAQEWTGNVQLSTTFQEDRKSGDERSANFYLTGPLTDKLSLKVSGQTTVRDEDQIIEGYEDKSLNSISSTLTYQATVNHEFSFEAGISEQNREGNAGYTLEDGAETELDEYTRSYYSLAHQGNWGKVGRSSSYLQYEDTKNKTREMENMNTIFKTSLVTPIYSHTLTSGFEYTYEKLEDFTSNSASDLTELDNQSFAIFLEDEWRIVDPFSLTIGARLDNDESFGTHISPRAYGVWSITDNWVLKGGVSTGYRSPSLRETSEDWAQGSNGGNVYGNEDLEPESSINQEISLNYQNDYGLTSSITLFHNDFEDKITRVACPSCGPVNSNGNVATQRVNVDKATTQGVEVTLATPLGDSVYWNNSYTFNDSEQKSGEYKGQPLVQLPKHLFNSNISWQTTEDLETWAQVTYHGEEMEPTTGPSSSSLEAPSYTFVDMGVTYMLTADITLNGAIYNLLDEDVNYDEYGYVEDGRRYWVGMNIGF